MQVNILEAKNRLSQLIRSARAGEEVIIANRGEPVARLMPVVESVSGEGGGGTGETILRWLKTHPLPDYAKRSAEEIDQAIDEARDSWN
jgi:prevent-host-death family protein